MTDNNCISNSNLTVLEALNPLTAAAQWVAFKLEPDADRVRKIPLNPHTGQGAKANDSSTWGTFEQALNFAKQNGLIGETGGVRPQGHVAPQKGGIGFEFGNGFSGIDLDHVIEPDGTLKEFAREIIEIMNSYTEYSPSMTGLHVLFTVKGSPEEWKKFLGGKLGVKVGDIEFYTGTHFFTVTGKPYGEVKAIEERTKEVKEVYRKYLLKDENKKPLTQEGVKKVQIDMSDQELLEKMLNSKNGYNLQSLWKGDISLYGNDRSRADMALCNALAFWTNGDAVRMDNLFRQSGLMREKWDRPTAGSTYGAITIDKAIANMSNGYVGTSSSSQRIENSSKISEGTSQKFLTDERPEQSVSKWQPPLMNFDYLNDGLMMGDLEKFRKFPEVKTGFENLDEEQGGLVPGFYVLGATPSTGKTSFCLQMADNIAKSGQIVLYFALEQNRLELTTKSLSRLTAQRNVKLAVSSVNIRRGKYLNSEQRETVKCAIDEYQKFSNNIAIIELGIDTTMSTITNFVNDFMEHTGLRPVVILDYLQIVRPDNPKMTSPKEFVDLHTRALKKIQSDNDLVLIGICSFNRQNYTSPVDFSSFKETGSIEYTADVVWGLQYQIVKTNEGVFLGSDKDERNKRDLIDKATQEIPRKLMLKNLKNRYGKRGYSCGFLYDCRFDWFVVDSSFRGVK